jgi:hypothetical protein
LGSHLTGYELARPLAEVARRRSYPHQSGSPAAVDFACQGVTETLREVDGSVVPASSVDLVNASGVVGHHLDAHTVVALAEELRRALCMGGVAMLDVGPTLGERALSRVMATRGFRRLARCRSWALDPTGQVVFRKEPDLPASIW